jgi:hypothetical protein
MFRAGQDFGYRPDPPYISTRAAQIDHRRRIPDADDIHQSHFHRAAGISNYPQRIKKLGKNPIEKNLSFVHTNLETIRKVKYISFLDAEVVLNNRVSQLLLLSIVTLSKAFPQIFTDGPSVVANADSRLEVFARGSDGAVWKFSAVARTATCITCGSSRQTEPGPAGTT